MDFEKLNSNATNIIKKIKESLNIPCIRLVYGEINSRIYFYLSKGLSEDEIIEKLKTKKLLVQIVTQEIISNKAMHSFTTPREVVIHDYHKASNENNLYSHLHFFGETPEQTNERNLREIENSLLYQRKQKESLLNITTPIIFTFNKETSIRAYLIHTIEKQEVFPNWEIHNMRISTNQESELVLNYNYLIGPDNYSNIAFTDHFFVMKISNWSDEFSVISHSHTRGVDDLTESETNDEQIARIINDMKNKQLTINHPNFMNGFHLHKLINLLKVFKFNVSGEELVSMYLQKSYQNIIFNYRKHVYLNKLYRQYESYYSKFIKDFIGKHFKPSEVNKVTFAKEFAEFTRQIIKKTFMLPRDFKEEFKNEIVRHNTINHIDDEETSYITTLMTTIISRLKRTLVDQGIPVFKIYGGVVRTIVELYFLNINRSTRNNQTEDADTIYTKLLELLNTQQIDIDVLVSNRHDDFEDDFENDVLEDDVLMGGSILTPRNIPIIEEEIQPSVFSSMSLGIIRKICVNENHWYIDITEVLTTWDAEPESYDFEGLLPIVDVSSLFDNKKINRSDKISNIFWNIKNKKLNFTNIDFVDPFHIKHLIKLYKKGYESNPVINKLIVGRLLETCRDVACYNLKKLEYFPHYNGNDHDQYPEIVESFYHTLFFNHIKFLKEHDTVAWKEIVEFIHANKPTMSESYHDQILQIQLLEHFDLKSL